MGKTLTRTVIGCLVSAVLAAGCSQDQGLFDFKVGGHYSISWEEGSFRIVKVLAVDERCVHIRLYKNKYSSRPTTIDPTSLKLGGYDDPEGISMGHLPASLRTFIGMQPQFIAQTTVTEEELEGYNVWKKDGGGSCF